MVQALEKYRDYLDVELRYAAYTVEAYLKDIGGFASFLEEVGVSYLEVDYDVVRSWIVVLSKEGLVNRSINRKMSALKSFYLFLQKTAVVEVNPLRFHRSLKVGHIVQVPFSEQELLEVRSLFEGKSDFDSVRDLLIIELLYGLGLRRGELVALRVLDVDLYSRTIRIQGKGAKVRVMPLLDVLSGLLERYLVLREACFLGVDDAYLVLTNHGKKVNDSFVYRIVNDYFSKVSSKEKRSPHVLRHTFATHLLNNGADINSIKELMGHASLSSTEIYTHASLSELKQVYKAAHPRMKKR